MYVCSCFGVTEAQVRQHAQDGRRTPRAVAGACRAGTDCGSCVKRIQALLGRTAPAPAAGSAPAPAARTASAPAARTAPCPVHGSSGRDVAAAA